MKLTEAEREAMWQAHTQQGPHFNRLVMTVERIVAARLEQQREALAAAVEASADRYNLADEWAFRKASMIVREFGTEA